MVDVLAIIPARGGSKGVPGKNKRVVGGQPLIAYSLDAAKAASCIARVVISTDDEDIVRIARDNGVAAILRPADIATDTSPVIDAVRHALAELKARDGFAPGAIVLLQPTSPLRTPDDIDAAVALFFEGGKPVCSVYQCDDNHPARMYRIEGNQLVSLMPELASIRRQDLPPVYHRNGAIYVFGPAEVESGAIIGDDMNAYIMGPRSSINIDSELDIKLLEAVLGEEG